MDIALFIVAAILTASFLVIAVSVAYMTAKTAIDVWQGRL